MNKLPSIPVIDKPSALLDLVANSKLYHERMKKLLDYQEHINVQVKYLDEIADLVSYKNQVQAKEQRVIEREQKAGKYVELKQAEGDKYLLEVTARVDKVSSGLRGERYRLEEKEASLQKKETTLKYRETDLTNLKVELTRLKSETEARSVEAKEVLRRYEDKLAAINALAKE